MYFLLFFSSRKGWNSICKWFVNFDVFSLVVLAQLPSAKLIGGMNYCGCLTFIVAFYIEYSAASVTFSPFRYFHIASFFSSSDSFLRSFTALLNLALLCGERVSCHCFLNFLFALIFILIFLDQPSCYSPNSLFGVAFQANLCIFTFIVKWDSVVCVTLACLVWQLLGNSRMTSPNSKQYP